MSPAEGLRQRAFPTVSLSLLRTFSSTIPTNKANDVSGALKPDILIKRFKCFFQRATRRAEGNARISTYIMSDRDLDESDRDLATTDQDFIEGDFQISLRAGHRVADDLTVSKEYCSFYRHCKY